MADLRDMLEKFKEFFSVDNLSKPRNKVILLLIMLAGIPLILYFSVSAGEASRLASIQGPEWTTYSEIDGEEIFQISVYDPIARDKNSGDFRNIHYNITFAQIEGYTYVQPLDVYWIKIQNVTVSIDFTTGINPWNISVYSSSYNENKNLSFGESVIGEFDFTDLFVDYEGDEKLTWDQFHINIIINCTDYISEENEYKTIDVSFEGQVVDTNELFALNYPQGQRIALQVLIIYWVITGLALVAYLFYLNKKKYSFIRPY